MNDSSDELLTACATIRELLDLVGWSNMTDRELRNESRLGNGAAEPILKARAVLRKAYGKC